MSKRQALTDMIPLYGLGALLSSYPQPDFVAETTAFLEQAQVLIAAEEVHPEAWEIIHSSLHTFQQEPEQLDQLRSAYIDLFDRAHTENPLYETEYGRNRSVSKATELADLAGFYQAFGLESEGLAEMPDHVSVELEFYSYLLLKQQYLDTLLDAEGAAVVWDARSKFMQRHLGCFVGSICECAGVQQHSFYHALFTWLKTLVALECQRLDVTPDPLNLYGSESLSEEMGCGLLGGCQVATMMGQKEGG